MNGIGDRIVKPPRCRVAKHLGCRPSRQFEEQALPSHLERRIPVVLSDGGVERNEFAPGGRSFDDARLAGPGLVSFEDDAIARPRGAGAGVVGLGEGE